MLSNKPLKKITRIAFFAACIALGFIISLGLISFAVLLLTKLFVATYSMLPMWGFDILNTTIGLLLDFPAISVIVLPTAFLMANWLFNKTTQFLNWREDTHDYQWKNIPTEIILPGVSALGLWLFNKSAWFLTLVPDDKDYGWGDLFADVKSFFVTIVSQPFNPQKITMESSANKDSWAYIAPLQLSARKPQDEETDTPKATPKATSKPTSKPANTADNAGLPTGDTTLSSLERIAAAP